MNELTFSGLFRISIHALLAESDTEHCGRVERFCDFYPRSPCGERPAQTVRDLCGTAISIHALLAESDVKVQEGWYDERYISIHALLAESDYRLGGRAGNTFVFLSTLSLRRATRGYFKVHSPPTNFYPRSPCGERLYISVSIVVSQVFLSTLSLRRATPRTLLQRRF